MKKALILVIFIILILQISLVSAQQYYWCIVSAGNDYVCTNISTLTTNEAAEACAFVGGQLSSNQDDSRCITGCCCNPGDELLDSPNSVMSEYSCTNIHNYVFHTNDDEGFKDMSETNCDLLCDGKNVQGGTTATYSISGTVKDLDENPKESVTVYYPSYGVMRHVLTDNEGKYEVFGVPKGDVTLLFKHPECIQQKLDLNINEDLENQDIDLNCTASGCMPSVPTNLQAIINNGEEAIHLLWDHDNNCNDEGGYNIYEVNCETDDGSPGKNIGYVPFSAGELNFTITQNLPFDEEKCYQVSAETRVGEQFSNKVGPIGYLSKYCMTHDPDTTRGHFCINNEEVSYIDGADGNYKTALVTGIFQCSNNQLATNNLCSGTEICSNNRCVEPTKCELCNGLYGFFTNSLAKILGTNIDCQKLIEKGECYLDNNGLIIDTYKDCAYVNSCYDYKSEYACENSHCLASDVSCEWHPTSEDGPGTGQSELGFGVCRPTSVDESNSRCELCDDLLLDCDEEACESWMGGNCYYNPLTKDCLNKGEVYCELFSKDDCTNDPLGVCEVNSNDACIKNANNYIDDYEHSDCEEYGLGDNMDCLLDYEAPTTTLTFESGALLTEAELVAHKPIVVDNREDAHTMTYACIEEGTSTDCVPTRDQQWGDLDVDEPSQYTINYFSEDDAGNQEKMRNITITLYNVSKARLKNVSVKSSGSNN